MKLSVIIVNYNVRPFLEQCLYSLRAALQGIEAEIWVVDNASKDDSIHCLQRDFPKVKWILNTKNLGFSKANNQALEKASGEFILFLNPDTLVPEDCLQKCIAFMKHQPDAGALGIKMLDGSGKYLPESKRGYPGTLTSFFKITGLHKLFPQSGLFARYYMGHLPPDKNHPVEVLAGAFLMVRKNVLDATGGFDERFFMYGEDIDLSFRINHLPTDSEDVFWKTYYLAETSIIHFKGESTKKGSLNYVLIFYKAMIQFVQKHQGSGPAAGLFKVLIYMAIAFRALASGLSRLFSLLAGILIWIFSIPGHLWNNKKGKHYIEFADLPTCTIVGAREDFDRIRYILSQNKEPFLVNEDSLVDPAGISIEKLSQKISRVGNRGKYVVIFCPGPSLGLKEMMAFIHPSKKISYLFHYPDSNCIIGSTDKNKAGETFILAGE